MNSPDDWVAVQPGMGSCFHRALHRWAELHVNDPSHGFKIAIGIVAPCAMEPVRHLHAWLERGDAVLSAISGDAWHRNIFYHEVGVEPGSIKYVNPRRLMRAARFAIDKATVTALLDESGHRWRSENGGVIPA